MESAGQRPWWRKARNERARGRGKLRNREWLRRHTKICINGKRNVESMGNCGTRERKEEIGQQQTVIREGKE